MCQTWVPRKLRCLAKKLCHSIKIYSVSGYVSPCSTSALIIMSTCECFGTVLHPLIASCVECVPICLSGRSTALPVGSLRCASFMRHARLRSDFVRYKTRNCIALDVFFLCDRANYEKHVQTTRVERISEWRFWRAEGKNEQLIGAVDPVGNDSVLFGLKQCFFHISIEWLFLGNPGSVLPVWHYRMRHFLWKSKIHIYIYKLCEYSWKYIYLTVDCNRKRTLPVNNV